MLFAITAYLIHGVLFGCAARRVSKYRSAPDGFWWGFLLGAAGLLIVVFRGQEQVTAQSHMPPKWRCVKCGTYNSGGRDRCQSCGSAQDAPDPVKVCPSCGAKNKAANGVCFACGCVFQR